MRESNLSSANSKHIREPISQMYVLNLLIWYFRESSEQNKIKPHNPPTLLSLIKL